MAPGDGHDVVVVGSGAAGLTAAATAAAEGLRVLLLEASEFIGGTTAISGGMIWAPANAHLPGDSLDAARLYLDAAAPASRGDPLREIFLTNAGPAMADLERRTALRLRPVTTYPDYYPDLPGATTGGRVLEPVPFDGLELGEAFAWLRPPLPEFTLFGGMMVSRADLPHFRRVFRDPRSFLRVARLVAQYGLQRLKAARGTTLYLGNALAGRLLKSCLDRGVEIRRNVTVAALVMQDGRVARLRTGSGETLSARRGVVLATGGLSHDPQLRARILPALAQETSAAVPVRAKAGARLAGEIGARIAATDANPAFWVPASRFTRRDGSAGTFPHTVTDRGKPGLIAVDATGRRFVNEALSYHEFVMAQLRAGERAVPAWLVCDSHFLWTYGLGAIRPFRRDLRHETATGYLRSAGSIAALAKAINVPSDALVQTVSRFNAGAAQGRDDEFGRGGDAYQRYLGDATVTPNPCVAPILKPLFHAIAVFPAELGAATGLVTDEDACVLDADGRPIPGLHAVGNDMHSVMGGAYPGPGITLGPALTFAWLAARRLASPQARAS